MLCALLVCNMLGGGHLTRAMAHARRRSSATAYMKRRTRLHPFPHENIYKTLRVTLMASENVTYCGASHFYTLLGWQDDFGVPLDCSDGESVHAGWWDHGAQRRRTGISFTGDASTMPQSIAP